MIVSEKNVSDALAYLAQDPHPLALARKDVTDAENKSKRIYAELFGVSLDNSGGTVKARECFVERTPAYQAAKSEEGEAILSFERHRARVKAAEMLIEVWRTENANIRAAERVR